LESVQNTAGPSTSSGHSLLALFRVHRLFLLTVVLPTIIAIIYFGFIASDIFISESRFVVRSPQRQSQTSVVGALLQGTGFSRAQDDTYPVIDFIKSRDALRELNKQNFVVNAYGRQGDWVSRFPSFDRDESFEALYRYYDKRIVSVDFDSTSAIATVKVQAFNPTDAQHINETLLELGEQLINRMNSRAAQDTVQLAQQQVAVAANKAKDAAVALAAFRNGNTVFDPDRQSALQLQGVMSLQGQMLTAQTQLLQLQAISPENPQISSLKTTIGSLQKQISEQTGNVAGGRGSLSQKAGDYARVQLDVQFADRQLTAAMASLETAQSEAQRKQLYLERLVEPNRPDAALEPKRLKGIFIVLVLGLICWGILSLLLAGVREHND
jgi:capsular polysaccharide transport system permease protein